MARLIRRTGAPRPGALVLTALIGFALAQTPVLHAQAPERPNVIVSTEWLAAHLDDPNLVLLHVGMRHQGVPEELIPGARFLDYHEVAVERDGLSTELPPVETLVGAFRAIGLSNESRVVVYGAPGHVPARIFMTLDYLGHGQRTAVLDGGLAAWKAEGHPLETTAASAEPGDFEPHVREDVLVTAEWIRDRLEDPGVTLIDARPADEYSGERTVRDLRPGHIPGAYNLYWEDLVASSELPRLKDLEAVRSRFEESGASEESVLVSYCMIGMRASFTYLISRHLGYEARFYDGSWNDWGAREELPAATGSQEP
jgi:thiosulfate/3-mercaptopyruvate sulfurtransferase